MALNEQQRTSTLQQVSKRKRLKNIFKLPSRNAAGSALGSVAIYPLINQAFVLISVIASQFSEKSKY